MPREPKTRKSDDDTFPFSEANWKPIAKIASIVVAVALSLLSIIGFALRDSLTPRLLDAAFGLSDHVQETVATRLANNIDSGYSQLFQITSTPGRKYLTTFYAKQGQKVHVTVTGHAVSQLKKSPIPVKVIIDKVPWTTIWIPDPDSSFRYNGDVTAHLNFSDPQLADVHEVRLVPEALGDGEEVFVRTLVLVQNDFSRN
jgi:hypothetical protein